MQSLRLEAEVFHSALLSEMEEQELDRLKGEVNWVGKGGGAECWGGGGGHSLF